ncbi:MAG: extracellular solute-binding protein [Lachnospiraceae bacterium]|nr:extracellular solute-binding protein [Lachnospiraceae bacterium]
MKKSFIYIIMVILALFATGCTGRNDEAGQEETVSGDDVTYEAVKTLEEPTGTLYWYRAKGSKIYVTAISVTRGEQLQAEALMGSPADLEQFSASKESKVTGIYRFDEEGGNMEALTMPPNLPDVMDMAGTFDFDEAENIYYMYEDAPEHRVMVKCSPDGRSSARTDGNGAFDISGEDIHTNFCVTPDGTVALYSQNTLYLLDENLALSETVSVKKGELYGITLSKTGEILCLLSNVSAGDTTCRIAVLDMAKKELGQYYKSPVETVNMIFSGIGDYDLYYSDGYGMFGYDMENETGKKLFDYALSGSTSDVIPLQNGNFFGETNTEGDTGTLAVYQKKEVDANTQKKMLTFATLGNNSEITDIIYQFNKEQSDIEIVIKDYADSVERMNADMIAGNVPDIYDLQDLSVMQYVKNGYLEELTPYYEADASLGVEDLLPSVVEAMETAGGLYYVADGFDVLSLAAKTSDVGTDSGWSYAEMENVLREKDSNAKFFYIDEKVLLLQMILGCETSDFVDMKTGTCSFDSEDFKILLETCNTRGVDEEEFHWTKGEAELLRSGDVLFRYATSDIDDFKETFAAFSEEVNFIGYPCSDRKGNYVNFTSRLGISAKSEYKEEAWEFLRYIMSKEYQGSVMSMMHLPTRKDCFDLWMEAQMAEEDYTNEMGWKIFANRYTADIDGVPYEVAPLTKEQAEQYVDMVNRAVKPAEWDSHIMEIVMEEAAAYFAGDKSVDDVVDVIQKRVRIYVSESL